MDTHRAAGRRSGWTAPPTRLTLPGLLLALGLLFASSPGWAETPDFNAALLKHPRWLQAEATVAEARGQLRQAMSLSNPELEWRHTRPDASGEASTAPIRELELRLPLEPLVALPATLRMARALVRQMEARREILRRELVLEAGTLWWEGLRLASDVASVTALLQGERALARSVEARARVGELRPMEAERAWLACQSATVDSVRTAAEMEVWKVRAEAWGWAPPARDAWAALAQLPALPESATDSPVDNPQLVAAQGRVEEEKARRARLRAGWSEGLGVVLAEESQQGRRDRSLGLAWQLPLFDRKRGERQAARAAEQGARLAWEEENAALAREHWALVLSLTAMREEARLHLEELLPRARRAAEALEKAWRLGEASLFETLEARRVMEESRRDAAEALVRAHVGRLRLDLLEEREWK